MNRNDIIRMAREAGFMAVSDQDGGWYESFPEEIEHFFQAAYAAGQADGREAAAEVCDSISVDQWALYKGRPPYTGQEIERASEYTQGKSDGAEVCANAIRARGQQ